MSPFFEVIGMLVCVVFFGLAVWVEGLMILSVFSSRGKGEPK